MTIYEKISIIISSIALVVSLLSVIFSKINMNKIEKIYYGQSELAIRESITNAKNKITDILSNVNNQNNLYTKQCMKVAIEQLLNSYEEACAKYIDSKIDKKDLKRHILMKLRILWNQKSLINILNLVLSMMLLKRYIMNGLI